MTAQGQDEQRMLARRVPPKAAKGLGSKEPGTRRAGRGPTWLLLMGVAVVLIVGIGGLVLAALFGVRDGLAQRQAAQATAVAQHFERGVRFLGTQETELAEAEFGRVLELDPGHELALAHLRDLQQSGTHSEVATAIPQPTPTVTPTAAYEAAPETTAPLDTLFDEANQLLEAGQWEDAVLRLEQLRAIAPDYQSDAVSTMLFEAHLRRAQQLAGADHVEAALRSFDEALALRPEDEDVQLQRELLSLYAHAVGIGAADWSETIATLGDLYARRPDYRDVEERLLDAYRTYGDTLARKEEWCAAAQQYGQGLAIREEPELARLRDEADMLCRTATPTPGPEASSSLSPPSASESTDVNPAPEQRFSSPGRIVVSVFGGESGQPEVWLLTESGQASLPLASAASQATLSPDGQVVVFRSHRDDMLGLVMMAATGGGWQRVTQYAEDSEPSWSPDGQRIAFASNREGDRRWRIYQTWVQSEDPAAVVAFGRAPSWSPDGSRIAYQGCNNEGGRCGLWAVGLNDGMQAQLTDVPGDTMPAWSPDGQTVAFASQERSGNWDLYLLDLASGEVRTLVAYPAQDSAPAWSPDGGQLAFLSDPGGAWGMYVLSIDGEHEPLLAQQFTGESGDWLSARISWRP